MLGYLITVLGRMRPVGHKLDTPALEDPKVIFENRRVETRMKLQPQRRQVQIFFHITEQIARM